SNFLLICSSATFPTSSLCQAPPAKIYRKCLMLNGIFHAQLGRVFPANSYNRNRGKIKKACLRSRPVPFWNQDFASNGCKINTLQPLKINPCILLDLATLGMGGVA